MFQVHGIIRRSSSFNTGRIEHLYRDQSAHIGGITLHYGDLTDTTCLVKIISKVKPTEIYNLAAMSHVKASVESQVSIDSLSLKKSLDFIDILS